MVEDPNMIMEATSSNQTVFEVYMSNPPSYVKALLFIQPNKLRLSADPDRLRDNFRLAIIAAGNVLDDLQLFLGTFQKKRQRP